MASVDTAASFDPDEEAIRIARAHLDSSLDFFVRMTRAQAGRRCHVAKALRTLDKAAKIIFSLAYEKIDERSSSRSRKQRLSVSNLATTKLNEAELSDFDQATMDQLDCSFSSAVRKKKAPNNRLTRSICNSTIHFDQVSEMLVDHQLDSQALPSDQESLLSTRRSSKDLGYSSKPPKNKLLASRKLVKRASLPASMEVQRPLEKASKGHRCSHDEEKRTPSAQRIRSSLQEPADRSRSQRTVRDTLNQSNSTGQWEAGRDHESASQVSGYVSKHRAARKLVKRAKTSQRLKRAQQAIRNPAAGSTGQESQTSFRCTELSKETVDAIFRNSIHVRAFAANLMRQLFDHSELIECTNVMGRPTGTKKLNNSTDHFKKAALDPVRVDFIRRQVLERVGPSDKIWSSCIGRMNQMLHDLKKSFRSRKM